MNLKTNIKMLQGKLKPLYIHTNAITKKLSLLYLDQFKSKNKIQNESSGKCSTLGLSSLSLKKQKNPR